MTRSLRALTDGRGGAGCRGTGGAEQRGTGRDGRRGAAHRATHRPAGKASPDAFGSEDEARPLGKGAEPHAVEPDHPLRHGPRGRAAWGERRPSEPALASRPAPAEARRQPARRRRRLPLPRLREWSPAIAMRCYLTRSVRLRCCRQLPPPPPAPPAGGGRGEGGKPRPSAARRRPRAAPGLSAGLGSLPQVAGPTERETGVYGGRSVLQPAGPSSGCPSCPAGMLGCWQGRAPLSALEAPFLPAAAQPAPAGTPTETGTRRQIPTPGACVFSKWCLQQLMRHQASLRFPPRLLPGQSLLLLRQRCIPCCPSKPDPIAPGGLQGGLLSPAAILLHEEKPRGNDR